MNASELTFLAKTLLENIDVTKYELTEEYDYSCIPLCIIDSVYSIGVRYEGVKNVISRACQWLEIPKQHQPNQPASLTTTAFVQKLLKHSPEYLAKNVFKNSQRTSPTNGILKADAVCRFASVVTKYHVETLSDVYRIANNSSFDAEIKKIPGQTSGISTKYFLMLAGSSDLIKPDRMIVRFLENTLQRKVHISECQHIISEVCKLIKQSHHYMTPKILDNVIWQYQRSQQNGQAK